MGDWLRRGTDLLGLNLVLINYLVLRLSMTNRKKENRKYIEFGAAASNMGVEIVIF